MTRLPSDGGPGAQFSRNQGQGNPFQIQRDAGGTTPGLVATPYVDKSFSDTAQLLRAFGLIDNLAGAASSLIRVERGIINDRRMDAEKAARDAKQEQEVLRGVGIQEARVKLPSMLDKISQSREIIPPDQVEARARGLIDDALPMLDPVSGQAARDFAMDNLIAGVTANNRALREEGRQHATESIVAAVPGKVDAAGLLESKAALMANDPALTDLEASSMVYKAAADYAVAKGEPDRLTAAEGLLPAGVLDTEKQIARTRAQATQERFLGQQEDEAVADLAGLQNAGVPASVLLSTSLDDPRITEPKRAELRRSLEAQVNHELREAQGFSANTLKRDVTLGRIDGPKAIDEITRRMSIGDPKSTEFIDATEGGELLRAVAAKAKFDSRVAKVTQNFAGPGGPVLTKEDGPAMLKVLAASGVVTGTEKGDGFVLTGIKDPAAFATSAVRTGLVPGDAADLINAGLAANDPQQVGAALTQFSALGLADEGLAVGMLPSSNDPKALGAQMRARYVLSRLQYEGVDPKDNAAVSAAVARYAPLAMKMVPALQDVTAKQVLGIVYYQDPDRSLKNETGFNADTASKARADMRTATRVKLNASPAFIPAEVGATYNELLQQEFRVQASLIPDQERAADAARKWAAERTLRLHPPKTWGGAVYYGQRGETPLDEQLMRDDLKRTFGEGSASELWTDYVPEFVKDGDKWGWQFRSLIDPEHVRRYENTGVPIVMNPYVHTTEAETAVLERVRLVPSPYPANADLPPGFTPNRSAFDIKPLRWEGR